MRDYLTNLLRLNVRNIYGLTDNQAVELVELHLDERCLPMHMSVNHQDILNLIREGESADNIITINEHRNVDEKLINFENVTAPIGVIRVLARTCLNRGGTANVGGNDPNARRWTDVLHIFFNEYLNGSSLSDLRLNQIGQAFLNTDDFDYELSEQVTFQYFSKLGDNITIGWLINEIGAINDVALNWKKKMLASNVRYKILSGPDNNNVNKLNNIQAELSDIQVLINDATLEKELDGHIDYIKNRYLDIDNNLNQLNNNWKDVMLAFFYGLAFVYREFNDNGSINTQYLNIYNDQFNRPINIARADNFAFENALITGMADFCYQWGLPLAGSFFGDLGFPNFCKADRHVVRAANYYHNNANASIRSNPSIRRALNWLFTCSTEENNLQPRILDKICYFAGSEKWYFAGNGSGFNQKFLDALRKYNRRRQSTKVC